MAHRPLSIVDQFFLWLERSRQPMHVGAVQIFDYPDDADDAYPTQLIAALRQAPPPQPPFNQRLEWSWQGAFWRDDDRFDLLQHLHHWALPAGADAHALDRLVAHLHSAPLDRSRPLWDCHVITGLPERRFAVYTRIHHAMVDGMSGMRLMRNALSDDPRQRQLPPLWATPRPRRKRTTDQGAGPALPWHRQAGAQIATVPTVTRELFRSLQEAKARGDYVSVFQAPRSLLNRRISSSRSFATRSVPLAEVRALAQQHRATVNDIVLAACAGALRQWCLAHRALPTTPLIAMVPMSLRARDDGTPGNQVAALLANLGTHLTDPLSRLATIQRSVDHGKRRFAQMSPAEIRNYTTLTLAPAGLNLITGLKPKQQAFNVVVSNVPGPDTAQYWNGARLRALYPVSIALDGQALNITLTSTGDRLHFGAIACAQVFPELATLLDQLVDSLAELAAASVQQQAS